MSKPDITYAKWRAAASFSDMRKLAASYLTQPMVRLLARTRVTPDTVTWMGFTLTIGAAVLIAVGHLFAAGFIVLGASFFDMLDGALARSTNQTTRFGAILDSTLDRLSEAAVLTGILVFHALNATPQSTFIVLLAAAAMTGSFLVSYVRARAEGAGLKCEVGLFSRAERVLVIVLGLLLSQIDYALILSLAIVVIFSFITVGQRVFHVWQQTRK